MTTLFSFYREVFINNIQPICLYNVVTIIIMMFVRSKKKGNRTYYWIVESIRIKGKVIQKPIRYIGSAESLLEKLELLEQLLRKKS